MSLKTDLNVSPYFDDFDESKNFHRVLFVPEQAIQARELTQLQTILQNQIERFGDSVYLSGSVIKGCAFKYDTAYDYVKLRDLRVNLDKNTLSDLVGLTVKDEVSGLFGVVVDYKDGFETQNPDTKTIYVKYMNTGTSQKKTFAADDEITFYTAAGVLQADYTVKVLPTTLDAVAVNPIGTGYGFSIGDGIVYQNGFFIRVPDDISVVVSKYNNSPNNVVVGLTTKETIVTEFSDTSLYDNSKGFSNEKAPGAHRIKLEAKLEVYTANSVPDNNFVILAEWKNGEVVRENRNSVYSTLGQEFARRTAEESGDYVVSPFIVTTSAVAGNTTHLNLNTTQGLAYVNGYRVQKLNNLSTPVRKATNTSIINSQQIVANYGNYVLINEVVGYFEPNKVSTVSLRDTAGTRISSGGSFVLTAPGSEIGTAKLLSVALHSGVPGVDSTQYKLYLTDIVMSSGKNFQDVKCARVSTGLGDLVLESGKAVLKESNFATLVYPFGQGAIKTLRDGANNDTSFVFRTTTTAHSIANTGTTGAITLSGTQEFPYGIGTLNETQELKILAVPSTSANVTLTKSGSVATANSNTAFINGTSTAFVSEYQIGDYIAINTVATPVRIVGISNNTWMEVEPNIMSTVSAQSHAKRYPANVPIPFNNRNSSIVASNSTTLSLTLNSSNGQIETLSANLDLAITYDVRDFQALQRGKTVIENVYVKVDCSNNAGNTVGPWSLGLPDVFNIKSVYVSNAYTESAGLDKADEFVLDDGQRDGFYNLASISRIPGTSLSLANTDKLLIKCDVFVANGGTGFFSIDSYPIDDANTANTTAVTTQEIPYFFSDINGGKYNLRDCVDFRPLVSNTAIYATTEGAATINPVNTASISSASQNYVASPNETFDTALEFYYPRIDKLILDTTGNFQVIEGAPTSNPSPPLDINGAMTIATVYVKPYPSLSQIEAADYNREAMMVSTRDNQVPRFTMKDLREVAKRVENLEYYASLSLLEKKSTELTIKDASGLERFKNGIFVDGFDDSNIANISDFEFTAILDTKNSLVRPALDSHAIELEYDSGSNTYSSGQILSLSYTDETLFEQKKSSRTRSLGGPSWDEMPPTPEIWPPYDPVYDETVPPVRQYTGPYYSTHWNAQGYVDYYTNEDNTQKFTVEEIARRAGFTTTIELLIAGGTFYPRPDLYREYPLVDALPFTA